MITSSGVKRLDFGLAKFTTELAVAADVSRATQGGSRSLTEVGTILGTIRRISTES